ncbi:metallophosphoesterase [Limimaricola hongkongensis]|uniref:Serine/threonine protein phosphatase I n=1 Tax=Limimaricola hongkongensis DSM 17492 TaxID=1122180 RepID=A0A017H8A9_9RHOB|nr:metallophosphoesterase [Limimaricola hongkongensis]EYD70408.1 serine/threonine protein phosphatase I [Limimaricola hongkongensis DSM 17492]
MRLPLFRHPFPPPAPATPFHAIGDVHGRLDLLAPLLRRIARRGSDHPIVVLGDMIDRGPDSAGVLRLLHHWRHEQLVCLAGNHEAMMLGFLADPVRRAALWLRNGGTESLGSFGIAPPDLATPGAAAECAAALSRALGPMENWLRGLPLRWSSGNVVAVHAALDPARPPGMQDEKTLLWGHPRFAGTPRRDGLWVVHGHVVQDAPSAEGGRIAVDTGAWFTGRLTAARIAEGAVDFVTNDG